MTSPVAVAVVVFAVSYRILTRDLPKRRRVQGRKPSVTVLTASETAGAAD